MSNPYRKIQEPQPITRNSSWFPNSNNRDELCQMLEEYLRPYDERIAQAESNYLSIRDTIQGLQENIQACQDQQDQHDNRIKSAEILILQAFNHELSEEVEQMDLEEDSRKRSDSVV